MNEITKQVSEVLKPEVVAAVKVLSAVYEKTQNKKELSK